MESVNIPFDSQGRLCGLSRETLECHVCGRERQLGEVTDPFLLNSEYGAFVSLHKGTELRGCIGTCFPAAPLYEVVVEMTEAAASRDYRFSPVTPGELPDIGIGISVLSRLEVVHDPLALIGAHHGLHVAFGEQRGVLLPQVAKEYGWDMETFLSQTCLKADLPEDAWKWPETVVSSFTALIIEERR
jgi:AmmeMemoRadiSam system protein A